MNNHKTKIREEIDALPPKALAKEVQLDRLHDLLQSADTKELLDRLTLGNILERVLMKVSSDSRARTELDLPEIRSFGLPPRGVEFIIGILVCQDPDGSQSVTYHELAEQFARVNDAYQLNLTALYADQAIDEQQYHLQRGLAHRELTTGRFHHPTQAVQAARRCYTPFAEEMDDALGYTIEDAIQVVGFLITTLDAQVKRLLVRNHASFQIPETLKSAMEQDPGTTGGVYQMVENSQLQASARFIDSIYDEWQDQLDAFWFNTTAAINELPDEIDPATFLRVIDSLRVAIGEPTEIPNLPFEEPFDGPNPIEVRPILELEGKLSLSSGAAVARALAETYYYRLYSHMGARGQSDEFEQRWGDILEEWTQDTLTSVFSREEQIVNPEYRTPRGEDGETDIVIPYDRTLFVIECKSKKLPAESRSLDPADLESHLKKGVGKAVKQTAKFIKTLQQSGTLAVTTDNGTVTLDASEYDQYQPIIVLRDWYDHIATADYTNILPDLSHTPYVVDIFHLEILADILDSQEAFNDYVTARRRELREHRYFSMDELDYLGFYLKQGGRFPDPPSKNIWQLDNQTPYVEGRLSPGFTPDMRDLLDL